MVLIKTIQINGHDQTSVWLSMTEGVENCYVFKSRLQEYAQKVGIPTPVYETLMEGPSHEPVFRSTVIVNNIKYDSLPGFFNRKAAEQSAAEIALMELTKSGQMTECIPTVHETGLCKNLLQECAQKMNYAIPSYHCTKKATGSNPFTCTIEIGGIQYIGAAARTKKEAEIKAARTALLAIQSYYIWALNIDPLFHADTQYRKHLFWELKRRLILAPSLIPMNGLSDRVLCVNLMARRKSQEPSMILSAAFQYTVLPSKKKGKVDEKPQPQPASQIKPKNQFKPKKTKFKKKWSKRKLSRRKDQKLQKSCIDDQSGEVNTGISLPGVADDRNEEAEGQKANVESSAMGVNLQGQEAAS
ncbi:Double-stranded RNA-binding protein 8 [Apostasia shenzhenica]|uniref:Double-stranded RNA-binding protein 8 n=1 Tax=Apostasia shenzhenica TaxID=1088818 RepID=A0A2I0A1G5_9ASPA|nr:Double-stranded RNA-binding protein 8 [Apostasia shenzhenica]